MILEMLYKNVNKRVSGRKLNDPFFRGYFLRMVQLTLKLMFFTVLACTDRSTSCSRYGKSLCSHSWLKQNCQRYCGICTPSTQAPGKEQLRRIY